jgi:hypothetical protein
MINLYGFFSNFGLPVAVGKKFWIHLLTKKLSGSEVPTYKTGGIRSGTH